MSSISERLAAAGLPPLPRNAWLEIDEDALRNNVAVFRELAGPHVALNAVVKADAYGHGLVPVARVFESAGVDRLCVAYIDEAIALRTAGIEADILVLFPVPSTAVRETADRNIQLTTYDGSVLDQAVAELEVDTGLTRGGVKVDDLAAVMESVRAASPLAVWTHVASPEDEDATKAQVAQFERATVVAQESSGSLPIHHMAATGGLLTGRVPTYDGVRIGLGLYGLLPLDLPTPQDMQPFADRLRPAMELKCMPLRVDTFPEGTPVGYGGTWIAPRESVIATLPVGYGDGFARAYSPGAMALVHGSRVPIVGTIAMDALMADVTEIQGVGLDDEFVLLGRQGSESIGADELARLRNTIPWEVVTSMSFRLPRVYHAASVLMGSRTLNGELRVSGN